MKSLSLYYTPWCPYCVRVLRALEELDIEVELVDTAKNAAADRELREARGRSTVPVLKIVGDEGTTWMPESLDIIAFLKARAS